MKSRHAAALLALVAVFTLAACGSGSDDGTGGVEIGFGEQDTPRFPDSRDVVESPDLGAPKEVVEPPDQEDAGEDPDAVHGIFFLADEPVLLAQDDIIKLKVQVVDYENDGPADGAPVHLRLEAVEGNGDGSLAVQNVFTGREGRAELQVRAGTVAPAAYVLHATTPKARSEATIRIEVGEPPTGDLKITLNYGGGVPLSEIRVRLMSDSSFQCSQFYPPSPPSNYTDSQLVGSVTGSATFEDLEAETYYAAYVTARGPEGSLIAAGCVADLYVAPNGTRTYTLDIYNLVLNPAGIYDMVAVFDFTGAIPGEIGRIVDLVVDAFYDPGAFVFEMVELVVDLYLGQLVGQLVEWALDLFEDRLAEVINDWVFNNSPDWVQDIFTVGQDLTQIVGHLELLAHLRIMKLVDDYTVSGEENWIGLALYWRLNCPAEGEPDYDPECGRLALSLEQLQQTEFPMDLVQGRWTGTISGFNKLQITPHNIQLNYGRLVLFVLNEILIPNVTDDEYNSLYDAALGMIDCESVANNVIGDFLETLGIDPDDVENFCVDAISVVIGPIESLLYGLGADSSLRLSGEATLLDLNDDLIVDEIVDGYFEGWIQMGTGETGNPFNAYWHAVRQ